MTELHGLMEVLALKTVVGHDALTIQKRIPSSLILCSEQGRAEPQSA
jgi:hypothetical protein